MSVTVHGPCIRVRVAEPSCDPRWTWLAQVRS
eukprot:CAMPEP_0180239700 /NCGR_PEP_ID=MMETSP0987-20121128/31678_1 /TAXON_ID=697907 /ORGANISM="non described non described, Strain CCMP2293" /LENGTH=31 /DNA_ID= /DNA_START= /DNA_END= /DNA_ORIENTATION=